MARLDELPRVQVESRGAWRTWLADHAHEGRPIWLVVFKKHCADRHVPFPEMVEEALCFGWIDSRARRVDEDRMMVLMGPRRPGSIWSRINKDHVDRAIAAGRMTPAGQAVVDAAKADGSWHALDETEAGVEPEALRAALTGEARRRWDALAPSHRRQYLHWIRQAKTEPTRARRVAETVRRVLEG